uniref:Nmda receptor glutamate-binding chain n=1 Tax=Riptortus pedestris TaxID=329032 RepID=R4WDM5_RIPPE|nr:nmda receptor glutamate-binding chain [Riptortus pedestris]
MATIPLMEEDMESGGKECDIENDFAYRNNVSQAALKIRLGFLRKVYSLVFMQLFVTALFGFTLYFWQDGRLFVQNNYWLISVAFIVSVVTLIALHIKRKETPTNYILLSIFTVVQAYSIGVVVSFFEVVVVLQALFLTLAVLGGLTAYTFQTKRDFSSLGTVLFAALCVLLVAGILQLFFHNNTFEIIISVFGAFLFALFIVYDTQNIMHRLSPEEYILATIELYLDIVNLFLYILRALEATRR